jgi:predicted flap endonuclease-1-like 5' DNA nuclease
MRPSSGANCALGTPYNHFPHGSHVSILLALVAVVALAIGYAIGRARRGAIAPPATPDRPAPAAAVPTAAALPAVTASAVTASPPQTPADDGTIAERARIVRSYEAEAAILRRELTSRDGAIAQLITLADERRRLFDELAAARADTARYRQLVIDLENNAAPPFFGVGAPDDLKLIVGVGPVLERMLQMLGVTTYRQIARWTERDIDEFDAKLHEFPGRIRRDAWVTQARALHQSKYGEPLPSRERG